MNKKKVTKSVAKTKQKITLNKLEDPTLVVGMLLIEKRETDVFQIKEISKKGKIKISNIRNDWDRSYENTDKLLENYHIMDKSLEEYEQELMREMSSGWATYKQPSGEVTSKEIAVSCGADKAADAQRSLMAITKKMEILTSIMKRKQNELYEIKRSFEQQLKHVNKIVGIIELYLGVNEEIVQFQDGDAAPIETPITFRQLVLHMDEEVGDWRKGGWDFENVADFEQWLRVPKNLQQVLPEQKGVVVLRPRRNSKAYGTDDPFYEASQNHANLRATFVLIRNGEKLYHIFSEDIYIYPNLFPSPKEMQELYEIEQGLKETDWRTDKEKAENQLLGYQRNVLFLQGLMDRTDVMSPLPQGLSLFKPETYGECIKFIYDADGLTDGRKGYKEWLKEINSKLKRGDRIYLASYPSGIHYERNWSRQDYDRFPIQGWTHSPDKGVYNLLEEIKGKYTDGFKCNHLPDEEVYTKGNWLKDSGYSKRKKSTPFYVYIDDDFIINYELITIEDIDYYVNDRINRQHYMDMMPVLKGIRERLVSEKKMENEFIKMVKGSLLRESDTKVTDKDILEAIAWWKTKVIEKRPLTKDDAKAARMIMGYLKKKHDSEGYDILKPNRS